MQHNKRLLSEFEKRPFPLLLFGSEGPVLLKRFFDTRKEPGLRVDMHQQEIFRHNYATRPKLVTHNYPRRLRAHTNSDVMYMSVADQC